MKINRSKRMKLFTLIVSLLVITGSVIITGEIFDGKLEAAETTTNVKIKQVEMFNAYSVASGYAVGEDGYLYWMQNIAESANIPLTKVKLDSGVPLSNIKKVVTQNDINIPEYNWRNISALSNDNKVYLWSSTGTPHSSYPTLLDTSMVPGNIKDIIMTVNTVFLLTENGDLYARGSNEGGCIGNGTLDSTTSFVKTNLSNVKQMVTNYNTCYAITNDGYLWTWGAEGFGTGIVNNPTPTRVKSSEGGSDFNIKVKLLADTSSSVSINSVPPQSTILAFLSEDDKLYYMKNNYATCMGDDNSSYPALSTMDYDNLSSTSMMTFSFWNFSAVVDGTLYGLTQSYVDHDPNSNQATDQRNKFAPYVAGEINASTRVSAGAEIAQNTWVIRESDKKLFYNGHPVEFVVDLTVSAAKQSGSSYNENEKYDSDVIIDVTKSSDYNAYDIKYKYRDLLTNTTSAEATYDEYNDFIVKVKNNERVNRQYKFYVEGKEIETASYFTVDLYKHPFVGVKVDEEELVNSNHYPTNSLITWDSINGLAGNIVTSELTLPIPPGSPAGTLAEKKAISNGHDIGTITGVYSLELKDSYGNLFSVSFTVDAIASPTGVLLSDAGSFEYNNSITKENARLGELTLKYATGDIANAITALDISSGDTDHNFRVEKDEESGKWYLVANKTIPVGDYSLVFQGKAGRNFTRQLKNSDTDTVRTIHITKADNPMKWDTMTDTAITSGIFINEDFTIGIVDKPVEVGNVTYTLGTPTTGVSIDSSTGAITIGTITGDQVVIPIVATTDATANYNAKTLTGSITAKKQTLSLKTVSVVGDTEKDTIQYELGTALPNFKVVPKAALPSGFTLTQPDSYKIIKQGDATETAVATITSEGNYLIKPVYSSSTFTQYKEDWIYGTIIASAVTIDGTNASDFYTLKLDDTTGSTYTPGTWTNKDIKITPVHSTYTKMKVDAGSYSTTTQTYNKEGTNTISLKFQTIDGIEATTQVQNVKIDKTAPTTNPIQYEDASTSSSLLSSLLNAITFNQISTKAQKATFDGADTDSGIATYDYRLVEIDLNGNELGSPLQGQNTSVTLQKNKNYKLEVTAVDNVGNKGNTITDYIQISDETPVIKLDAKENGTNNTYDGTVWTSKPIDISLDIDQSGGSGLSIDKYAWSMDGVTYTDLPANSLTIPNTANINNVTYHFKATSTTGIDGFTTLLIKIDKDVPVFKILAKTTDNTIYDGTKTDQDVIIDFSQDNAYKNLSGVTYYYCNDATDAASNPITQPTLWNKINGTSFKLDSDQVNKTYYFKAVSGAGLVSTTPLTQTVWIEKKVPNPSDLEWSIVGNETLTYGSSTTLSIENTGGKDIEYTVVGGANCLEYDQSNHTVKAISGVCTTGNAMVITAQVGNYEDKLKKTIDVKKADLQLQTEFVVNGANTKSTKILKDGVLPALNVSFVTNKGLVPDDASITDANTLGTFTTQYKNSSGTTSSTINTNTLDSYEVKQILSMASVTAISNFSSKYVVTSLPANLEVSDNAIPDEDLYTILSISGQQANDSGWYTEAVNITPIHDEFNKMGIGSDTPKTGAQQFPNGSIIDGEHKITLTFEDALKNVVHAYPTIKIDSRIPEVLVTARSKGLTYNGSESEQNVSIALSQPNDNISKVTYYYCTNATVALTDPNGSNWTKVNGTSMIFDTNQDTTYYFKAISGAGLMSQNAVSQKVWINKKDPNPVNMAWDNGINDDLAYGDTSILKINNTNGKSITYTSVGGEDCLSLDEISGEVSAISGMCSTNMVVTAVVGNYATPLTKTFTAHKAKLNLQTVFEIKGSTDKNATILKGGTIPTTKVVLSKGTALVGEEKTIADVTTIGSFNEAYEKDGVFQPSVNTNDIGTIQITKKLDSASLTISNFTKKYDLVQDSATLIIADNDLPDSDLYSIKGPTANNSGWYTGAVQIIPIHAEFSKMGVDGGLASSQAQTYPQNGIVDGEHTLLLKFENTSGSFITKPGVIVNIDSVTPSFNISAKSNDLSYSSGIDTMYDIDITFVATNVNVSSVQYYVTSDVEANGNLKADATWVESGNFTIVKNATYYMKAVSGAGKESTPKKFVANINRPDTTKLPTIKVTSNDADFVADGTTWARNEVTFELSGNHTGYEVCSSSSKDRTIDCDNTSDNWMNINDDGNQIHRITNDQNLTYYWFRNKIPGFLTMSTKAYAVKMDSIAPDKPMINVSEQTNFLNSLFGDASSSYHKKPVNVAMQAEDDRSGIATILYDIYDANGNMVKENQTYRDVLTYEDTNIQIRAKAIDKAGNQGAISDNVVVCVDTIAPSITGVKDGASYYVPYVFISYEDKGSGIDLSNTTYTNNDKMEELGNNTLFNGKGNVSIHVQDKVGNSSSLSFEILGLPEHTDCSTESLALIDSIKAQYNDVKGHLNEIQKKEITDWLGNASNSCSITDPDHNVTVENPEAKIPADTILVVDVITTTIEDAEITLGKDEEVKMAYDVYFKKGETVFKDLEGSEMKVKLPLGAFKETKGLRLVSVEDDGTLNDIVYERDGDYAVFTTLTLKRYAFIAEKVKDPNINVDMDCDGDADLNIDTDSDGIPNINIDTTGDGKANYNVDLDGDEIPDLNIGPVDWTPDLCKKTDCGVAYCTSTYYKPYLNIDSDTDGRPDINVDLNKDMEADINIDTDFDNIPNVDIDSDGDGKADINIDDNGDGKADRNLLSLKEWTPNFDIDDPIKFDTMKNLKPNSSSSGDDKDDPNSSNGSGNSGSSDDTTTKDNVVNVEPSVKGSYTNTATGGALTGIQDILPWCIFLMLGSGILVTITIRRRRS